MLDQLLATYGFGALVRVKCGQGYLLKTRKLAAKQLVRAA